MLSARNTLRKALPSITSKRTISSTTAQIARPLIAKRNMTSFRPFIFPPSSSFFSDPFSVFDFDESQTNQRDAGGDGTVQTKSTDGSQALAQRPNNPSDFWQSAVLAPFSGPKTDIHDTGNALVVTAELPGIDKKDVHVSIDDKRKLTISGTFKSSHDYSGDQKQQQHEGGAQPSGGSTEVGNANNGGDKTAQPNKIARPLVSERSFGSFSRSWVLPKSIDTEAEIKANFENGLLKLSIPKRPVPEKKEPRSISIE